MEIIRQPKIEPTLLAEIASRAKVTHKTHGVLVNELLRKALREERVEEKIRKHNEGYEKTPVKPDEFEIEDEQMEAFWDQI